MKTFYETDDSLEINLKNYTNVFTIFQVKDSQLIYYQILFSTFMIDERTAYYLHRRDGV